MCLVFLYCQVFFFVFFYHLFGILLNGLCHCYYQTNLSEIIYDCEACKLSSSFFFFLLRYEFVFFVIFHEKSLNLISIGQV
jgi:hypothetical protein